MGSGVGIEGALRLGPCMVRAPAPGLPRWPRHADHLSVHNLWFVATANLVMGQ